MPVDVTPTNMIATCGGIGTAKVVQVLDFPAGIVGVNGVMRFLVLEEPMSTDGRQQFIPPLTPITLMRQLGANIRMKESGDVLEVGDDHGTTHTEKLVRERSGHVHNQLDFFTREGWKLPDMRNALMESETAWDDELPEGMWPNLNAMVTGLQQLYIGNHEEKPTARQHSFDRDCWAGSPSDYTMKLYRVRDVSHPSWFGNCVTQAALTDATAVSRDQL